MTGLLRSIKRHRDRADTAGILNEYTHSAPSNQGLIDIFKGEWSSQIPKKFGVEAGAIKLFEDARIKWAISVFGGVNGKRILELGPLEAGHSYMLEQGGAKSVVAVEANARALMKCLIVKEIAQLNRTRFLFGDFIEYLRNCHERFDICIASGVLYHLVNPIELIELISKVTDTVFIWTHYYDSRCASIRNFTEVNSSHAGFSCTLHRYDYEKALDWNGFCGGMNSYTHWMGRDDILSVLRYFGYKNITIEFEDLHHQNGPSFALVGKKQPL
ncbi:MAG: class I SAM-dependent methyltransferase [Patescibacteria group bacterium]|nr:class I SAM-dependent methyltransferase [Patescibacteria group bacterium]MDD5715604.1 class I SAM-dependent methyltransferase [Patescibacteria group bacterium]